MRVQVQVLRQETLRAAASRWKWKAPGQTETGLRVEGALVGGTVARMDRRLRRGRGKGALRSGRERLLVTSLGQRSGQCGPRYRASST